MTPLAAGAAAHHELLVTYIEQGFTRKEALQILMVIISYGLMTGGNADGR
jgi:hypothetical protein